MSQHKFKIYRFQPYDPQEYSSTARTNTINSQCTSSSQSFLQTDSYFHIAYKLPKTSQI